jgi:hypothetical protein
MLSQRLVQIRKNAIRPGMEVIIPPLRRVTVAEIQNAIEIEVAVAIAWGFSWPKDHHPFTVTALDPPKGMLVVVFDQVGWSGSRKV